MSLKIHAENAENEGKNSRAIDLVLIGAIVALVRELLPLLKDIIPFLIEIIKGFKDQAKK